MELNCGDNVKIIDDIIYNEDAHIVSVFKDYLIFDDVGEFLKRCYTYEECKSKKLSKILKFYENNYKQIPSYAALPEQKLMMKNLIRKQKRWKENKEFVDQLNKHRHKNKDLDLSVVWNSSIENIVFNTVAVESIENAPIFTDLWSEYASLASSLSQLVRHTIERSNSQSYEGNKEFDLASFNMLINDFAENYTESEYSEDITKCITNNLEKLSGNVAKVFNETFESEDKQLKSSDFEKHWKINLQIITNPDIKTEHEIRRENKNLK